MATAKTMKPCFGFQNTGKCRFGPACKFWHDPKGKPGKNASPATTERPRRTGATTEGLRQWKQLLNQSPSSTGGRPLSSVCDRFFKLGRTLIDIDIEAAQETIRSLAQDHGLSFVRYLAEQLIPAATGRVARINLWQNQVKPLFEIITHENIVDSAVLEQQVHIIYNFMLGIQCRRARHFFGLIILLLDDTAQDPDLDMPLLSLSTISKMIDANTTSIVNGSFQPVVEALAKALSESISLDTYAKLQANSDLAYIGRRLDIGVSLQLSGEKAKQPVDRPKFALPKHLPGSLASGGRRHDNDHSDITSISILPTSEEIVSKQSEYLPTNDTQTFHKEGIQGRLDREFRLLREDTIGQLRDAVSSRLERMRQPKQKDSKRDDIRTYAYDLVQVEAIAIDRLRGLDLLVCFRQPCTARDAKSRERWWEQSKRLQPGALVCVLSSDGSALFFAVAESTIVAKGPKATPNEKQKPSLSMDAAASYVHLNLVDHDSPSVVRCLHWYRESRPKHARTPRCLVEFPGVLLDSFKHTLEGLQRIAKKPNIPFIDMIAPSSGHVDPFDVPPPRYATKPGFSFDLGCLTRDGTSLKTSPQTRLSPEKLARTSQLDDTQASALIDALTRSIALIQGPPGTGKSFTGEKLIKVLLANGSKARMGPIICICYTNHALDQLLEHLLDAAVEQIIRIGSRSKSERLEKLNLRAVAQGAGRTRSEGYSLYQYGERLDSCRETMEDLLNELASCDSPSSLSKHLSTCNPAHFQTLFGNAKDKNGFEKVQRKPHKRFASWTKGGATSAAAARDINQLQRADLLGMTQTERRRIHSWWIGQIRRPIVNDICSTYQEFTATRRRRDMIHKDVDLRCLAAANIIGVTTTGLARNIELLQRLKSKVLICEEAGEVLESHTLTALLPSIEHAILIGDHLQLRPQINNYELQSTNPRGARFSLDVSLFERLVHPPYDTDPKLPYSTLATQRRMHPSISELIQSTLYPSLINGGQVDEYPDVMGMRKRLFWLDHGHAEDGAAQSEGTTTSHTNQHEIDMTVALTQHLIRQGEYEPDDIAVLTPYLGQLHRLRAQMAAHMEISVGERDLDELNALDADRGTTNPAASAAAAAALPLKKTTMLKSVRLATVDNFQGEEAKVVVISLVRCNDQGRCGFLRTPNRINVLLSRAKHGMYLIGNAATYGQVTMWSDVLDILQRDGNFGTEIGLKCPRHPDTGMAASCPDHFIQFSPEGGCNLPCERRLDCGHSCISRCHSNVLHRAVFCLEPCPRPRKGCDHLCPKRCGDACPEKCTRRLESTRLWLPCGHELESPRCFESQDPGSVRCGQMVERVVKGCGHTVTVPCWVQTDAEGYRCPSRCDAVLPCGHSCRSPCCACTVKEKATVTVNHGLCQQPCGRSYTACRHNCTTPCHGQSPCVPCQAPCDTRCSHSKCSKPCHEPCAPCADQTCASKCPHSACTLPCAAPCNWVPCSKRCDKSLSCGHQCPSVCGQECPDPKFCQVCASEDIRNAGVDFIMGMEYHEIDLDEDPCIFPDCGHPMTLSNLDGHMDMSRHYTISEGFNGGSGVPSAVAQTSLPFSSGEVKVCPTCRGSLRNIGRYGRIVRRALLDEATKKFITWSNAEVANLSEKLCDVQEALITETESSAADSRKRVAQAAQSATDDDKLGNDINRMSLIESIDYATGGVRLRPALNLWRRVANFRGLVRKEEQPIQRVADVVRFAARCRRLDSSSSSPSAAAPDTSHSFDLDQGSIQVKGFLQATVLLLQCENAILSAFFDKAKPGQVDLIRQRRPSFSAAAAAAAAADEHDVILSDFSINVCEELIALAHERTYPKEELEGHILITRFYLMAAGLFSASSSSSSPSPSPDNHQQQQQQQPTMADHNTSSPSPLYTRFRDLASHHLTSARALRSTYPGSTQSLEKELELAERMFRGEGVVFYQAVSDNEMRAVYRAMARDLGGTTGHWYTCVNDHPFTVGECGMPMERARCPECDGPVGGANHAPDRGVRRAEDIEALVGDVGRLRV